MAGRPPTKLDTPALKKVSKAREELVKQMEAESAARKKFDDAVVAALEENGMRVVAKAAEVSTDSIRAVRDKRARAAIAELEE